MERRLTEENRESQIDRLHSLSRMSSQELQEQSVLDVSPEEVPHLIDYWQLVLKRRWSVLVCLVVVFVTSPRMRQSARATS